ncbi:hypothetical protein [Terasakiella pusilla]|uniref:hypothetical protein n=1 Tax=Terasakiella pusilla TaxID=64973 RepID=UPI003AA971FA
MTIDQVALFKLKNHAQTKQIFVLQCPKNKWEKIKETVQGTRNFSIICDHDELREAKKGALCLVVSKNDVLVEYGLGLISSSDAVATTESRIKVIHCYNLKPAILSDLDEKFSKKIYKTNFTKNVLQSPQSQQLSKGLSKECLIAFSTFSSNKIPLEAIAAYLDPPKRYSSVMGLQYDAVNMALKAFDLTDGVEAESLETIGKKTSLTSLRVLEDAVIIHDSREIEGFDLIKSEVTGKAVFTKKNEKLEIYTANKLPIEECMGVDFVYINKVQNNVVLVQYKIIQKSGDDYIYRPDDQLKKEINRMELFSAQHPLDENEYRLNCEHFYLKFVPKDGKLGSRTILLPIDHYKKWIQTKDALGDRDGIRLSYESLNGAYLRPKAFMGLMRSGYIGSSKTTTYHLNILLDDIARNGSQSKTFVIAVQKLKEK